MNSSVSDIDACVPRPPSLEEIRTTGALIYAHIPPTPLVALDLGLPDRRIFLKLETQPPIGAFKIRPALGALLARGPGALQRGAATVSSGNLAYGMAWAAKALDIPFVAYMYRNAPRTKIDGVRRLGGDIRFITETLWWDYITGARTPEGPEIFINPVTDPGVLAGNASIGMEVLDQLPEVASIWAPFGGGGLVTGIASALRARKSTAGIYAVESDHAAPATGALAQDRICPVPVRPSFIRSMGGPCVVPNLWPLTRSLISGSSVANEASIIRAIGLLFHEAKVIAEGAGAASLAAVLTDPRATGDVVCIISGGNIDVQDYIQCLRGQAPAA